MGARVEALEIAKDRTALRSRAFLYAVPIGTLGGLIGLGGAEFRLPVLVGPLAYAAHRAVTLNLAVSLITVTAALITRCRTLALAALAPFVWAIGALIGGAMTSAYFGATVTGRLTKHQLERTILLLLLTIGTALIIEGFLSHQGAGFVPFTPIWHVVVGIPFGLAIGFVSSVLGVAGGEMIIPTLIFAFGVDIKTAGTASLLVSLPTVLVGVGRYASRGAFAEREDLRNTVAPMGLGSVIGAVIGGLLVGVTPTAVLKVGLGIVLIVSAARTFNRPACAR